MSVSESTRAAPANAHPHGDARDESTLEQLDRNTIELLNELRVASTGIQTMFAFLLIVPFNTGFRRTSSFERVDYFVSLLCIGLSAVLLIAPSIHHRLLFRQHQKSYLIRIGNRAAIWGIAFLAVGLTGILVLISDVVIGGVGALIVGVLAAATVGGLWFALPWRRRLRSYELRT